MSRHKLIYKYTITIESDNPEIFIKSIEIFAQEFSNYLEMLKTGNEKIKVTLDKE